MRGMFFGLLCLVPSALFGSDLQTVHFKNGDYLQGQVLGLQEESLIFRPNFQEQAMSLPLEALQGLDVNRQAEDINVVKGDGVKITIRGNEDTIFGEMKSLNNDEIILSPKFTETLSVARKFVEDVHFTFSEEVIFSGFDPFTNWEGDKGVKGWQQEGDKIFTSKRSTISQSIESVDEVKIQFEATWDKYFSLYVDFFVDQGAKKRVREGCQLKIQKSIVSISSYSGNRAIEQERRSYSSLSDGRAKFEIRASKLSGDVYFFVNEQLVAQWKDANLKRNQEESFIRFANRSKKLELSNFKVLQWDGYSPLQEEPSEEQKRIYTSKPWLKKNPESVEKKSGDLIFKNGDYLSAKILEVKNGFLITDGLLGKLKFPYKRLHRLNNQNVSIESVKRYRDDARIYTNYGDTLTLRLEQMSEEGITGFSQAFGKVQVPMSQIQHLDFHLYQ